MNVMGITKIPLEVTELTLIHSHPRDVSAFSQTCRMFYSLVYSNDSHLWRLLWFSQGFEDPRLADYGILPLKPFQWRIELQRRIKAEAIATKGLHNVNPETRLEFLQTLVDAIQTLSIHGPSIPIPANSQQLVWLGKMARDANILSRPVKALADADQGGADDCTIYEEEKREHIEELFLRHRLHAYLGPSSLETDEEVRTKCRNEARCFVYDLRNYNERNGWGPLVPNQVGLVNWMHVDHIIDVITRNLDDHGPLWGPNRPPVGFDSARPYSAPGSLGRKERDWAGVEGKWRRIVCFMDYRDLYVYNAAQEGRGVPRDRSVFAQPDFEEATRYIYLELHIVGYSPTYSANPVPLKPADTKSIKDLGLRPTIHFTGTSKGGSGNEASVRGLVRMTKDNNIRWSFVSIYDSLVQWRSEGVQIGAVASAMGIIGIWTGANRAPREPAGPFWLWKSGHLEHCHKCGRRM